MRTHTQIIEDTMSKEYMLFNGKKAPHLPRKHTLVVGSSGTHTLDNIGLRYFKDLFFYLKSKETTNIFNIKCNDPC